MYSYINIPLEYLNKKKVHGRDRYKMQEVDKTENKSYDL